MEYLYRFYDADEGLLYAGVSDDWTRRLREHWREKGWAGEIMSVFLETYPDRLAVLAAEKLAIRSERPRYNKQHNHPTLPQAAETPAASWSAEDIIILTILVVAAGYCIWKLTEAGVARYKHWKAERDEFREWKLARDDTEIAAAGTHTAEVPERPAMPVFLPRPVVLPKLVAVPQQMPRYEPVTLPSSPAPAIVMMAMYLWQMTHQRPRDDV